MSAIIPILVGMYLGSTFNMRTYKKGAADVYNPPDIESKIQTIDRSFTKSQYQLVETSSEARDFLDVDGELSLRIKKGDINVQGVGGYLKEIIDRENLVELLIRVQHETVTETVPSYVPTLMDWTSKSPDTVGTHYVRSLTYGGELIAFVRLTATNREDKQKIKAAITGHLQFSGNLDLNAKGNFEKLNKELQGIYNIDVQAMGTIMPSSPPTTIPELMELVERYPSEVNKLNGGKGRPLKAELFPLSSLKSDYKTYVANSAMNGLLKDVEAKFDDIRTASTLFNKWSNKITGEKKLSKEEEAKMGQYYKNLRSTMTAFQMAIRKMDTSSEGKLSQFDKALIAYGSSSDNIPNRFQRELWKLRIEVGGEKVEWNRPPGSGTTYIRWGSATCGKGQTLLYEGRVTGAPSRTFGNPASVHCVPTKEVDLPEVTRGSAPKAHLQAIATETPGGLSCALCLHGNVSTLMTVPSRTTCPEGWAEEYRGRLMVETDTYSGQDFLCVLESAAEGQPDSPSAAVYGPVWSRCDKCGGDQPVPCIVCTH